MSVIKKMSKFPRSKIFKTSLGDYLKFNGSIGGVNSKIYAIQGIVVSKNEGYFTDEGKAYDGNYLLNEFEKQIPENTICIVDFFEHQTYLSGTAIVKNSNNTQYCDLERTLNT